jgi:hypothetical protein
VATSPVAPNGEPHLWQGATRTGKMTLRRPPGADMIGRTGPNASPVDRFTGEHVVVRVTTAGGGRITLSGEEPNTNHHQRPQGSGWRRAARAARFRAALPSIPRKGRTRLERDRSSLIISVRPDAGRRLIPLMGSRSSHDGGARTIPPRPAEVTLEAPHPHPDLSANRPAPHAGEAGSGGGGVAPGDGALPSASWPGRRSRRGQPGSSVRGARGLPKAA